MSRLRLSLALALGALLLPAAPAGAIVGGQPATRDYPHMAALELRQDDGDFRFICGASLVRANVVLTAAHCVQDDPDTMEREDDPARYRLLLGTRDREQGGERIAADRVVDHPKYDPESGAYDVALLRLSRASSLGTPIRIAGDEDAESFEPGDQATIIGWGATFSGGDPVRQLREGEVPIVSDGTCGTGYTVTASFDPPTMICAGNMTGGEDSCQGDSGGPLMVPDAGGRLILVGDTSFGVGCAFPTQYGVYGEVAGRELRPFVEAGIAELSPGTEAPAAGGGGGETGGGGEEREQGRTTAGLPRRLGSASRARRLRRLRVLVRPSARLRRVSVTLRRNGRVVASGRRASLSRRGRVTLRPRGGLRAGRARLTLSARDDAGRRVRATRTVSLSR